VEYSVSRSNVPRELFAYYKMNSDKITIPTDVLYDIFHLLCDGPIALHDLKNKSYFHEFPWAVGQVCRHWRGAFLSRTDLWTSFALKPGDFSPAYVAEMSRRATIYLERSGQRPLTILVSTVERAGTRKEFPKTVWGILLSCSKRWKKANLVLKNRDVADELLECGGYMSSLESLRISIPDFTYPEDFDVFQVAPCLTELHLDDPEYTATWQFPWAQLTKLKIEASGRQFDNYRNELWDVLFQLENIEELCIMASYYPRPYSPLPIKRLPSLRILETSLHLVLVLSWFTAPLLEHLHIHECDYFRPRDSQLHEEALTSLIQRSSCHIRRLSFEYCSAEEIHAVLKALPNIEELSITHPGSFDIIEDITPGRDGCIYLPKLQVLQVTYFASENRLERAIPVFSRLLEARGKGLPHVNHDIVPLEKFVAWLTLSGKLSDEVLEVIHGWPSCVQVYINGSMLERWVPSLRSSLDNKGYYARLTDILGYEQRVAGARLPLVRRYI